MSIYRVGVHYGIHVYQGDRPVATFHNAAEATAFVAAANEHLTRVHGLDQPNRVFVDWGDENLRSWTITDPHAEDDGPPMPGSVIFRLDALEARVDALVDTMLHAGGCSDPDCGDCATEWGTDTGSDSDSGGHRAP